MRSTTMSQHREPILHRSASSVKSGKSSRVGNDYSLSIVSLIMERIIKDPSDPKLIKIDGTMELCEELDIDPGTVSWTDRLANKKHST